MTAGKLITLGDPGTEPPQSLTKAPGGFLWWYVDMIDDSGNGFVLIWSFGLPFLPGYASATRDGRPQVPRERPSVNLAIYNEGREEFYLLQELRASEVEWSPESRRWRFGRSQMSYHVDENDKVRLHVELDCDLPASTRSLRGEITLNGVLPRLARTDGDSQHEWSPMSGPAQAQAWFDDGAGRRVELAGPAYHDRNSGQTPLTDLGIEHWYWGRTVRDNQLEIFYVVWPSVGTTPSAWLVRIGSDGTSEWLEDLEVETSPSRSARFGMKYSDQVVLRRGGQVLLEIEQHRIVDDGPFYLRASMRTSPNGELGWSEWVRPDRIDLWQHRPLVRMRVHQMKGSNSMWLPLFSGFRQGRWRRLLLRGSSSPR